MARSRSSDGGVLQRARVDDPDGVEPGPARVDRRDPVDVGARELDARELARGHLLCSSATVRRSRSSGGSAATRRVRTGAATAPPAGRLRTPSSRSTPSPLSPWTVPAATQLRPRRRLSSGVEERQRGIAERAGGVSQRLVQTACNRAREPPTLDRMTYSELRASDAERERVVAFLREHALLGRLTDDELEERIGLAYAAVTVGDLETLIADLPRASRPGRARRARAAAATPVGRPPASPSRPAARADRPRHRRAARSAASAFAAARPDRAPSASR